MTPLKELLPDSLGTKLPIPSICATNSDHDDPIGSADMHRERRSVSPRPAPSSERIFIPPASTAGIAKNSGISLSIRSLTERDDSRSHEVAPCLRPSSARRAGVYERLVSGSTLDDHPLSVVLLSTKTLLLGSGIAAATWSETSPATSVRKKGARPGSSATRPHSTARRSALRHTARRRTASGA